MTEHIETTKTRVAINGFGRIGRMVFRAILESEREDIEVVAINDLADLETSLQLLKYDSVHGPLPFFAESLEKTSTGLKNEIGQILIGDDPETLAVRMFQERDPAQLPWKDLKIDVVMECSGFFTKKQEAQKHLEAGAQKVLISAPSPDADKTVVYGVNQQTLTAEDRIVSNASCTTNCLAPVVATLQKSVGVEQGYMTTIHAYTGDQSLIDRAHKDVRRARAGALSMIPTSTGAAQAVGLVLPEMQGRLDGTAIRVPTANVSLIDLTFVPTKPTTVDEINQAMIDAAEGALEGVLDVNDEPLVSVDFNHDPFSSIVDLTQTQVIDGKFCRVLSWYDNEWGFSNRMSDTAVYMHQKAC